jgi:hypothetical protein
LALFSEDFCFSRYSLGAVSSCGGGEEQPRGAVCSTSLRLNDKELRWLTLREMVSPKDTRLFPADVLPGCRRYKDLVEEALLPPMLLRLAPEVITKPQTQILMGIVPNHKAN